MVRISVVENYAKSGYALVIGLKFASLFYKCNGILKICCYFATYIIFSHLSEKQRLNKDVKVTEGFQEFYTFVKNYFVAF